VNRILIGKGDTPVYLLAPYGTRHGRHAPRAYAPRGQKAVRVAAGVALVAALAACVPLHAQDGPAWPDTFVARVEALALMQTLNANILASRSATVSLENWCRDHRLAAEPRIIADALSTPPKAPTDEQRQRLDVTAQDDVRYRRVRLRCGTRVLSDAENWYVPSRLTPEMNRLLDTTDTPFGRAVESLQPYRRTFAVTMLWAPLPPGWERERAPSLPATGAALAFPDALFEHRAVLYTRDNKPFSEVLEVYQKSVLAFEPPVPR
jgi:chorismate-pyruvate lyase